jgi:hypothetical protein
MLDRDLLSELQLVLIEPPDGGDTWPSGIWTRAEVLDAVSGGVRAIVRDTHLLVTRVEVAVVAGAVSVALPVDWLATGYLVWRSLTNVRSPLGPVDGFESDLALPSWESVPGTPIGYADLDRQTLTLRLVPTPAENGTLEILYVYRPAELTAITPGAQLPVAEEFTSAVKYGALAYLLRKVGRLLDSERADYCDRRYELTRVASTIILGGWS